MARPVVKKRLIRKDKDPAYRAEVAARLLLTREVVGLKQGAFAERAGIAANTYNQQEKGEKLPSLENAIALCDAYDLTLDWIYRGEPGGLRYEFVAAMKALRTARESR